jgi:serine phosphatase RsbU (regulator of sigma subunit)
MTVPLPAATGQVLGALTLVSAESGRVYGESDVQLAMEIARRAGVAVDNARLYARAEHAARTLQQSLLPPVLPPLPFADLASYYAPLGRDAELIGGDFYDVFPLSDGSWCLVIGDVSGKGVDAGALTAATRWTFRSAMSRFGVPGTAIRELNEALLQQQWDNRFVTVLAAVAEPTTDGVVLRYASGGHPGPIVFRGDAAAEVLPVEGQLVGLLPSADVPTREIHLAPGDALVLYTDGFTEARRGAQLFAEEGLLTALNTVPAGAGADELVKTLTDAVAAFGKQSDDMALLVLSLPPR